MNIRAGICFRPVSRALSPCSKSGYPVSCGSENRPASGRHGPEHVAQGKCSDNDPMEGFWGILKREIYYGRRFTDREDLIGMIVEYMAYYNSRRLQRGLGVLAPLEKHELCIAA